MHLENGRPVVGRTDNLEIIHDALQTSVGTYGDTEEQRFAWTKTAQDAEGAVTDARNLEVPATLFMSLSQLEDVVVAYGLENTDDQHIQTGVDETLSSIDRLK